MRTRFALVGAVFAILATLYLLGFFELVSDPKRARAALEGLGAWGPLLYVVSFSLLEPFFVPGIAFMAPGSLVFPFPQLFLYSWLGSIGAGIVGFSFARYLGRQYVESNMPARFRRWDERLARAGLTTVIVVRLTFFLAPPAHWILGLSKVPFPTFVLGTAIGFVPGIAAISWLLAEVGGTLWERMQAQPAWVWWALGAAVVAWVVVRRRLARSREAAARGTRPQEDPPGDAPSGP